MGISLKKKLAPVIVLLFFFCLSAKAQPASGLPFDEKASQLVALGKRYLATNNFQEASQTFIIASQRPENQHTTAVLYYLGITWYNLGELENSRRRLEQLLHEYPLTKYAEEAKYHLALVNLESAHVNDKERGMDLMLKIADEAKDENFRKDAFAAAKHFLFEVYDVNFLDLYFMFVVEKYRYLVLEGICFQLDKKNNGKQILSNIKSFEEEGRELTPYLHDLRKKYSGTKSGPGKSLTGGELRIAIFLGFNLQLRDTASAVPQRSMRALQIYEGIRYALDEAEGNPGPHVVIKIWDTRNDSNRVSTQLEELDAFEPDVILGDISTNPTIVLGRWAESHKVVQLIPQNNLDELIKDKKLVSLLHPSLARHGEAMAEYIKDSLHKELILVLNDYSYSTNIFAKSFIEKFNSLGGKAVEKRVLTYFDQAIKYIPETVKSGGYDGIYAPLESEENLGLLLSENTSGKYGIQVFGTFFWDKDSPVDNDSKTYAQLTYSTFSCDCNDSIKVSDFRQKYLEDNNLLPQNYTIWGYDFIHYLLQVSAGSNASVPLMEQILQAENWHGLHEDIQFSGKHTNQRVSIVRFSNGRLIKEN